jgi:peptidoglycan LD-endopeptidase CwlK
VSSRRVEDLEPVTREMARCFLAKADAAGVDVLITATLRTLTEQAALYTIGRTRPGEGVTKARPMGRKVTWARPGSSAHNFGMAVDFVPMFAGKPVWSAASPLWLQLGELGEACGFEWAGRWPKSRREFPHLQRPSWRDHIPKESTTASTKERI